MRCLVVALLYERSLYADSETSLKIGQYLMRLGVQKLVPQFLGHPGESRSLVGKSAAKDDFASRLFSSSVQFPVSLFSMGVGVGHRGRHAKFFGWAKSMVHAIDYVTK